MEVDGWMHTAEGDVYGKQKASITTRKSAVKKKNGVLALCCLKTGKNGVLSRKKRT